MFYSLIRCLILNFSQFFSPWEAKPHCIGEPLKPEQFSNKGDVGFVRDVCVDVVARNIYNNLKFPVSSSCEELANMQTSTGYFKYLKWKRSSKRNEKVTNEIMDKAEKLTTELLDNVSRNKPKNTDVMVSESLYENIKDAKCRLIDSGAVEEHSPIPDTLEDMKIFLCKRCAVRDNQDMHDAIDQLVGNNPSITNPRTEGSVAQATVTGIFRLLFDIEDGTNIRTGSAILKIPSLAPLYNTEFKYSDMYLREARFYGEILSSLYEIGKCKPFAPIAYSITRNCGLVLEDLTNSGYITVPSLESLDLDHSKLFLNMLAQVHIFGYTYFFNLDENDSIKKMIKPQLTAKRSEITKEKFDILCKMVQPYLSESLYKKILLVENEILAELQIQNNNHQNSINGLMHGDLHRKNFLFNYDGDGKVSGVKLIDWQLCTVGGAALDLIEFFVLNLHEEVFEANEDNLLDYYIEQLNHNLSFLRSNLVFSRLDLNQDMAFFKYYYFKVWARLIIYWDASQSAENQALVTTNIVKWMMYFEKKGYL